MSATVRTAHGSSLKATEPTTVAPRYELVDLDRYVVIHDRPVGYVEVVPPLFVCHLGHPYPRAVEIAQTYDFDDAVQTVLARAESVRPHRPIA